MTYRNFFLILRDHGYTEKQIIKLDAILRNYELDFLGKEEI